MYIWNGEIEENWSYLDNDEFENIDREKIISANTFEEALGKLKSLYPIGEEIDNEDFNVESDDKIDRMPVYTRKAIRIVKLERIKKIDV